MLLLCDAGRTSGRVNIRATGPLIGQGSPVPITARLKPPEPDDEESADSSGQHDLAHLDAVWRDGD